MSQPDTTSAGFIAWLQGKIDQINEFERLGRQYVAENDQASFIDVMRQKALLLSRIYKDADPYLEEMEDENALDYAERGLSTYSFNAGKAIDLDSVFYMSALLFPDDHQPGQPHNLEIFRDEMKKRLGL